MTLRGLADFGRRACVCGRSGVHQEQAGSNTRSCWEAHNIHVCCAREYQIVLREPLLSSLSLA